mgnify:FL=1
MKNSDWDLDYRHVVDGEKTVAHLLSIETVEVKNDRRWSETGNVYIETDCYYVNSQAWEPSGISVSKASHWAFVLDDVVVILPLERLQKIMNKFGRPITCNIPPNFSRGFLISVVELMAVI